MFSLDKINVLIWKNQNKSMGEVSGLNARLWHGTLILSATVWWTIILSILFQNMLGACQVFASIFHRCNTRFTPKPALSKYSIFNLKLSEATDSWIRFCYHCSAEMFKSCRWLKVVNIIIIAICLLLQNWSVRVSTGKIVMPVMPCPVFRGGLRGGDSLLSQNTGVDTHSIQWLQTILI